MTIPESTKSSLRQRLQERAEERWPQLSEVAVRFRGSFAYVDGVTPEGEALPLCRLAYVRSASSWRFAIYLGSKGKYENSALPSGFFAGPAEDALDCACALYFNDWSVLVE